MLDLFDVLADHLKDLSADDVAAWYLRLAKHIENNNKTVKDPLAPKLLRYWLNGKGVKLIFPAPDHLKKSGYVNDVLKQHRSWYLSQQQFKGKTVGIVPRLQGKPGVQKWQVLGTKGLLNGIVTMTLESLVEVPALTWGALSDGDFDLLTALHGFQLKTTVNVEGSVRGSKADIKFVMFQAQAVDRYDWDPNKYFTVPNPDYKNTFKVSSPVAPDLKKIMVYHKNAIRVEKAGKAWPYDLESEPWTITDVQIMGPATVEF